MFILRFHCHGANFTNILHATCERKLESLKIFKPEPDLIIIFWVYLGD